MHSTMPVSSMMPVNILVGVEASACPSQFYSGYSKDKLKLGLHPRGQQQIRPQPAPFDLAQLNDFVQALHALSGDGFPRVAAAQNFRRVKKSDAMRQTLQQE